MDGTRDPHLKLFRAVSRRQSSGSGQGWNRCKAAVRRFSTTPLSFSVDPAIERYERIEICTNEFWFVTDMKCRELGRFPAPYLVVIGAQQCEIRSREALLRTNLVCVWRGPHSFAPYLDEYRFNSDKSGSVEKLRVSAYQQCHSGGDSSSPARDTKFCSKLRLSLFMVGWVGVPLLP